MPLDGPSEGNHNKKGYSYEEAREIWLALRRAPVCFPHLDLGRFFTTLTSYGIIPGRDWVDYIARERIIYEYTILLNPSHQEESLVEVAKLREVKKWWGTGDIEEAIINILQTNGDLQTLLLSQGKRPDEGER